MPSNILNVPGFGCLPRNDKPGDVFGIYEDKVALIPRSEWPELASKCKLSKLVRKIKNQRQEGSCASNATTQAFEIVWNMTNGVNRWVEMSAISLYKRVGRSAQSGSTISGNLKEMRDRGALPVNTSKQSAKYKHTMPETGFHLPMPSGWEETGKLFRITEWLDITSFDGMVSAILRGGPVVYGRAGHAICGADVERRNGWGIRYANSWGNWGENGYGFDTESFVSRSIASYGAFAPVVTTISRGVI